MCERGPADGAAAPLEDAAVGDAGVGALAPPVEGQALGAAHAVGEREAEAKPRGRGLDRLGGADYVVLADGADQVRFDGTASWSGTRTFVSGPGPRFRGPGRDLYQEPISNNK